MQAKQAILSVTESRATTAPNQLCWLQTNPKTGSRSPIKGSDQDKNSTHWLFQPFPASSSVEPPAPPEPPVRAWALSFSCFVQSPIWF
jgi:hypothetical protein